MSRAARGPRWLTSRRQPGRGLIPSPARFEESFDRFEALLGLVHTHLTSGEVLGGPNHSWGPVGEFAYRQRYLFGTPLLATMAEELRSASDNQLAPVGRRPLRQRPPLRHGGPGDEPVQRAGRVSAPAVTRTSVAPERRVMVETRAGLRSSGGSASSAP